MNKDMRSRALSHILKEMESPNIGISIENNVEEIQKANDSIHEFMLLAPICLPSTTEVSWHRKSAFLTYHHEAFYQAHRSFLEALTGYYNAAFTLLRSTNELIIKGAFWECLAHEDFRNRAGVIKKHRVKIEGSKKTLLDWFEDLIEREPSIKEDMEKTSGGIFDKISPIFEDRVLWRLIPPLKKIIEQLSQWGILDPIPDPVNKIYSIYGNLSADVHVIPDKTDVGRRLLLENENDIFEVDVIPEELSNFMKVLHEVIDIGIVIELNILGDWINQDGGVKTRLKERLAVVEDLGLKYSFEKLNRLVGE